LYFDANHLTPEGNEVAGAVLADAITTLGFGPQQR
jgi:hypothetical protein